MMIFTKISPYRITILSEKQSIPLANSPLPTEIIPDRPYNKTIALYISFRTNEVSEIMRHRILDTFRDITLSIK